MQRPYYVSLKPALLVPGRDSDDDEPVSKRVKLSYGEGNEDSNTSSVPTTPTPAPKTTLPTALKLAVPKPKWTAPKPTASKPAGPKSTVLKPTAPTIQSTATYDDMLREVMGEVYVSIAEDLDKSEKGHKEVDRIKTQLDVYRSLQAERAEIEAQLERHKHNAVNSFYSTSFPPKVAELLKSRYEVIWDEPFPSAPFATPSAKTTMTPQAKGSTQTERPSNLTQAQDSSEAEIAETTETQTVTVSNQEETAHNSQDSESDDANSEDSHSDHSASAHSASEHSASEKSASEDAGSEHGAAGFFNPAAWIDEDATKINNQQDPNWEDTL